MQVNIAVFHSNFIENGSMQIKTTMFQTRQILQEPDPTILVP